MESYLDSEGKLACSAPGLQDTVADLAGAVERFCQENINCSTCADTCCAGFIVYADNVFLRNLERLLCQSNPDDDIAELLRRSLGLDPGSGKWFIPQGQEGKCQYLSRHGRCLVYKFRPLVCRLHVCRQAAADYREFKDNLYYAYHEALKVEMTCLITGESAAMPEYWAAPNPLLGMEDYSAVISEVGDWAKASRQRMKLNF
jgi:Fe-S-cluster containining protein